MTEPGGVPRPRRQPDGGRRRRRSGRPARGAAARRRPDPALVGHDARARSATRGWRGYSVDLRGHGDSEWAADGDYTLDALSGDVLAISRTFDTPPALVGASLGGISSLAAIGEHPDEDVARALVLVDVAPRIEEAGPRCASARSWPSTWTTGFASLDEVADAIQRVQPAPAPPDRTSAGSRRTCASGDDGRWYWHWDPAFISRQARRQGRDALVARRSGAAPGRGARAHASRRCSSAAGSATCSARRARRSCSQLVPHARLVDVAGAGHMVAGDRNDLFNDAVVGFLDEVVGRV